MEKESATCNPEMVLEGVVTNVTNFGAFVDIGVHQDGLVHISALADRFVKDPREVVKAGDVVKVKVLEVDITAQTHRPHDAPWRQRQRPRAATADQPRAGQQARQTIAAKRQPQQHAQPQPEFGDGSGVFQVEKISANGIGLQPALVLGCRPGCEAIQARLAGQMAW
jgi:uncharacterized protein